MAPHTTTRPPPKHVNLGDALRRLSTRYRPPGRCRGTRDSSLNHTRRQSPQFHPCTFVHQRTDKHRRRRRRTGPTCSLLARKPASRSQFVLTPFSNQICVQQFSLLWQYGDAIAEPGCSDLVLQLLCEAFHFGAGLELTETAATCPRDVT